MPKLKTKKKKQQKKRAPYPNGAFVEIKKFLKTFLEINRKLSRLPKIDETLTSVWNSVCDLTLSDVKFEDENGNHLCTVITSKVPEVGEILRLTLPHPVAFLEASGEEEEKKLNFNFWTQSEKFEQSLSFRVESVMRMVDYSYPDDEKYWMATEGFIVILSPAWRKVLIEKTRKDEKS